MNICIFGDSITWGGYDPNNGGWATLLRNNLEKEYDDVTTYNLGICGDDSSGLLKRFNNEAKFRVPDLIILAIDANDAKHQKDILVSFDNFQKNIDELIIQAKKYTNKLVILGITPVDEKLTTPRNKPPYNFRENKDINQLNNILRDLSEKEKITFIPIPKDFTTDDLDDGLHPNTQGHLKIFEKIKPVVENLID